MNNKQVIHRSVPNVKVIQIIEALENKLANTFESNPSA
jgi:hypothetical protein